MRNLISLEPHDGELPFKKALKGESSRLESFGYVGFEIRDKSKPEVAA